MTEQVKIFRAKGHFIKNRKKIALSAELRAIKIEHALEKLYSEIGSRHRVKRSEIFIPKKETLQ